jgi:AcrR family transcriptional regulator
MILRQRFCQSDRHLVCSASFGRVVISYGVECILDFCRVRRWLRLRQIPPRRTPRQECAARRLSSILDAAAELIVEVGYEATTMTGIAERAGASVGALDDYLPDKTSIAFALLNQYAQEIEAHWKPLTEHAESLIHNEFADQFIENMLEFMSAPIQHSRDPAARRATRPAFANAFRSRNSLLTADRAFTAANIALQVVRGMTTLLTDAGTGAKELIPSEFKKILTFYLGRVIKLVICEEAEQILA